MLSFIERFDTWVDAALHRLTKLWSRVTGKDNFALARLTMQSSIWLLSIGAVLQYLINRSGWDLISVACSPVWVWIGRYKLDLFGRIQRSVERMDGLLDVKPYEIRNLATTRIFHAFYGIILIPGVILLRPVSIGFVMFGWSHYFVFHFDCLGGKSLARRALDAAKKVAQKIKDMAPEVAPRPIPIPARF